MLPSQTSFDNLCIDKVAKGCPSNLPIDAHNLAPWIKLIIVGGNGETITVSNDACVNCFPKHSAVVKSMEYGSTDALTINIVVHDQAGGTFDSLVKGMNTDANKFNVDYSMKIQWGWVGVKCGQPINLESSQLVTFLVTSLTASFDQGKIVYEIEGTDMWKQMMQTRAYKVQGDDGEPREIKQAIKKLFSDQPQPTIKPENVKFLRRLPDGSVGKKEYEIKIKKGKGGKDVVSSWDATNKSKIAAALGWIKPYVTDEGKGFSDFTWDVTKSGEPGVIFWEDNTTGQEIANCDCTQLGFFIVNGSKRSNVISFQPKFKWNFVHLGNSGGNMPATGTSNAVAGDLKETPNPNGLGNKGQGIQQAGDSMGTSMAMRTIGTDKESVKQGSENQVKHSNSKTPHIFPVEAEMVIQGAPHMVNTQLMYKQWVSIIVVNPFHLLGDYLGDGDKKCPDWTIKPPCNEMMTNKGWFVRGVNHSIKDGSYTTTLKIYLAGPGGTKPAGTPLGCRGPAIN